MNSTTISSKNRDIVAQYVKDKLMNLKPGLLLTMTIKADTYGDYFVYPVIATWSVDTEGNAEQNSYMQLTCI